MKRIALSALTAFVLTMNVASADFRVMELVEKSYELVLRDVTLPSSTAGTIIFKECDDCDPRSLRVTAATRYLLNGRELPFADFRFAAETLRAADEPVGVYVHYDVETLNVNRIRVVE